MEITLAPEALFVVNNLVVTNSVFTSFIVVLLIILLFGLLTFNFKVYKPGKLQLIFEILLTGLFDLLKNIMGKSKAKKIFGLVFTLFIFILVSNWFGLLPFALTTAINHSHQTDTGHTELNFMKDCIQEKKCYLTLNGIEKFERSLHVFRAPSSDLSATLSLALIAVFSVNFLGVRELKLGYVKRYLYFLNAGELVKNIKSEINMGGRSTKSAMAAVVGVVFTFFINTFVGILEIVSEIGKIISFSFRLLGNIFAGEVLLAILTSLTFGLATLPFLGLEIFVGVIQALVFFMLTSVFISLAISEH